MVVIENASGYGVPEYALKRTAGAVLRILRLPRSWLLEVRLVDSRRMYALNRKYRGKAHATTVLSFPGGGFPAGNGRILGEVYLCPQRILRAALPQYVAGRGATAYLMYFLIHGILHLKGFSHEGSVRERLRMERAEQRIFQQMRFHEPKAVLRH